MARPHILFIQAQDISWQKGLYAPGRDDIEMKILSIDEAGTDATTVIRYPKGWSRTEPEFVTAHEEFLVLAGSITINGQSYRTHQYGFLPAGYTRQSASSEQGCVLLTTFADRPEVKAGAGPDYDEKLLIPFVDPMTMEWDEGLTDPKFAGGTSIKPLRNDPYTGEQSFLYCTRPHRVPAGMMKPKWTHPMIEEVFCIDGEYVWGDCGRMGPGGYVWWLEGEYHGPAGTDAGYHLWVRTVDGPLANTIAEEKSPFFWDPEFTPSLPDDLKKIAKPYVRPPNY